MGHYARKCLELSQVKTVEKKQQYSVSMIAAISQDKVVSHQILEGGVDSVIFENFVYQTLLSLRKDKDLMDKDIVLLMDNAAIHKHSQVKETARKMKVNILFNAEYSPWLNPIEQLFRYLKEKLKAESL